MDASVLVVAPRARRDDVDGFLPRSRRVECLPLAGRGATALVGGCGARVLVGVMRESDVGAFC
jgi:hypothetical protein